MLLQRDNWCNGYNQILSDCRVGGTVLILCNPDADALCAARILSYAFRADKVPYQLRPCAGFQRLIQLLTRLASSSSTSTTISYDADGNTVLDSSTSSTFMNSQHDNDEYHNLLSTTANSDGYTINTTSVRAIILLNLGATRNLAKHLFHPTVISETEIRPPLLNADQTKLYILDSHRPYHLANIHAGKSIVLWNDYEDWHAEEGIPSDGDGLSANDDDSSEDSSDDSDDEDDDEENEDENEHDDDEGEAEFQDPEGDDTTIAASQRQQQQPDSDIDTDNDTTTIERRKRSSSSSSTEDNDNHIKRHRLDASTQDTASTQDIDSSVHDHSDIDEDDLDDTSKNYHPNTTLETISLTPTQTQPTITSPPTQLTARELHRNRRDRIRRYYKAGTFYSSPIAFMAYTLLSTQLRHESVGDLLWLACVGVTDAYIHNRLDLCGYVMMAQELKKHVDRTYPMEDMTKRASNAFYAETLYQDENEYNHNSELRMNEMTKVGFSENGRVLTANDEFRFFLLRHTSLWEAMRLSPEVCSKMELWRNSGVRKLQEMLAKMGLPLSQCQQPYAFMNAKLKRRMRDLFLEHAEDFGLENISYTGFIRVTGYKSLISACDMSLAVTALLECDTVNPRYQSQTNHYDEADSSTYSNNYEKEEETMISSFNVAYDALNCNDSSNSEGLALSSLVNGGEMTSNSGLGAGIRLALSLQKAIISTAVNLVERNAITLLSHFRYAYLHCTSQGVNGGSSFQTKSRTHSPDNEDQSHHIFAMPLALTKLANFLIQIHRSNKKWVGSKSKPLVLISEKPQTQTYLVVGYEYPEEDDGNTKKNKFAQNFELAAKTMQVPITFDSFESNVIEVRRGDVQKFLENLHYMIDSL